ncbi:MAG: M12 family metallo-peptidase, partial [Planctomycetota bacterium]
MLSSLPLFLSFLTQTTPARELVALALPTDLPARLALAVPVGGGAWTLALERHDLRAPDAFVRVVGAGGRTHDEPPPPATTYRGNVRGEPGSFVTATLRPEGLQAWIELAEGERFELLPAGGARHRLAPWVPEDFACGAPAAPATPEPVDVLAAHAAPLRPNCLREAEIAFDADYAYYQAKGSSVANVVAAIDTILAQVEHFYARDVQITYALTAYVVRTAPFYTPTSGGSLLDQFRTEWVTNQAAIQRDIAHLMTGEPGSVIEYGGLAYVGVVCNTNVHYGWSMDGANIVGHELGHNWGAGHCHDVERCNNMCGACFFVGPRTREIILAFRDSRACLDTVPSYALPLAPYVAPDGAARRKDELANGAPLAFDVLANDADGNCGPLLVREFERTSAQGGTVARAAGAGGKHRDELVY